MRLYVAALAAAIAVAGCPASRDHPGTGPSALWTIVSRCVDRQTAAYCSCPPFEPVSYTHLTLPTILLV